MTKLTDPITINNLELKSRLVLPPMATEKSADGLVSDALCSYYDEKTASKDFGLVITEHAYIDKAGQASKGQLSIAADEDIPGLKKVVDVIHNNNTPIFAQINHAGSRAVNAHPDQTPAAPSAVAHPRSKPEDKLPYAMSQADIDKLITDFVQAAKRAKAAGYDGVEIHSAHGYLLNQFYSPLTNKRTDQYNGSTIEGRTLLQRQIIQAVREAVGPDYPIALRLGACDYMPGGSTIEDSAAAAKLLAAAGLDLLDLTGGLGGYIKPGDNSEGYFRDLGLAAKNAVSIPVIVTGGIKTGPGAQSLLDENAADLVGVGRALLVDSKWPKKALKELEA